MKRNIAYRYRAYPDEAQEILLRKTFGCARFLWNQMLCDIMTYYEKEHKALYPTPAQYKKNHDISVYQIRGIALPTVTL